jgi:hypothetical protein
MILTGHPSAEVILRMFVLQRIIACGWYGIGVAWRHQDSTDGCGRAHKGMVDPLQCLRVRELYAFPVVTPLNLGKGKLEQMCSRK